jgi:hypothetical protein
MPMTLLDSALVGGSLEYLLRSGSLSLEEEQSGTLQVSILKDAAAQCFVHKDTIKAAGYRWHPTWNQWGKCRSGQEGFFSLLKAGALTASEQEGALVVSNAFGTTYDARKSISKAGFLWDKESKTYLMKNATEKQREAVRKINEKAQTKPLFQVGGRSLVGLERLFVGMPPAEPHRHSAHYLLGSEEAVQSWNEFNDEYDWSDGMYGGTPF